MSQKVIFANKWIKLIEKEISAGDKKLKYYLVERPDYVAIAPIFEDKILILHQKRFGAGKIIKNIPMGILGKGESPKAAAQRELFEETGIRMNKKDFIHLGSYYIAPSFTPIKCYLYAVECISDAINESSDMQEKHEIIKIEWIDIKKLESADDIDMTTRLAIAMINNKAEEL